MRKFSIEQIRMLVEDYDEIYNEMRGCMHPICGIENVKRLVASINFSSDFCGRAFAIVQMIEQFQLYGEIEINEILNSCLENMNSNVERAQSLVKNNNSNADSDMVEFYTTMGDSLSKLFETCKSITNIIRNEVIM